MANLADYTNKADAFKTDQEGNITALYQDLAVLEAAETRARADAAEELRRQFAEDSQAAKDLQARTDEDRRKMLSDMQVTQSEQQVAAAIARAAADALRREQDTIAIDAIFARGANRGSMIWPMFRYQIPDIPATMEETRGIIFGLYSGAYVHGIKYLTDVTAETLAQIVNNYDQAMAELSADEQNAIKDIMARRYLEELSLAAKDVELLNKGRKLTVAVSEMDARIAALEADRKALETKKLQLMFAKEKMAIAIDELETQIRGRYYIDTQEEYDLIKTELERDKAIHQTLLMSLRVMDAQKEALESAYRLATAPIELQELNTAIKRLELDIQDVDLRVSQTEADTAHMTVQIDKETRVIQELEIAKAETETYIAETELVKAKGPLIDARIAAADDQLMNIIPTMEQVIDQDKAADLAVQEADSDHKIRNFETRAANYKQKADISDSISNMEINNYKEEGAMIRSNADSRKAYDRARVSANYKKNDAAEQAAEIMRKAEITSILTHSIGRK